MEMKQETPGSKGGRVHTVAKVQEIKENNKALKVQVDGLTLGIYRSGGKYYAYENVCPHQGGPACEGEVMGMAKCNVSPRGERLGEYISTEDYAIVCPWHGVEYDIRTGSSTADGSLRLRSFRVSVAGDDVRVEI